MVTLRRETPPAAMEIGVKLLFISAGKRWTLSLYDCAWGNKHGTYQDAKPVKIKVIFAFFYPIELNDEID